MTRVTRRLSKNSWDIKIKMGVSIRNIGTCRGWCWQGKKTMRIIREHFEGKKRTTCVAIYQSLTELASNNSSDVFNAFNSQIAELSGKSISTIKNYCRELVKLGLLEKRLRKKDERINLANEWKLLAPSVNNNYPTLGENDSITSDKNTSPQSEKDYKNKNIKNKDEEKVKKEDSGSKQKMLRGEGYRRYQEMANSLRRTPF